MTLAATVWSKPLVPKEILDEPEFPGLVQFEFSAAESALRNAYLSATPEFRQIAEMILHLDNTLHSVEQVLDELASQNLGQDINDQILSCRTDFKIVVDTVVSIKKDLQEGTPKTVDVRKLVVGFPTKKPPIPSYVSDLIDDLTTLKDMPGVPNPSRVENQITALENQEDQMAKAFVALDKSSIAAEQAEQKAHRDMVYPRRVFNELLHEANLISLSPVIIFDAARLWQGGLLPGEVRYAIGGGLRLSIVSLDITAGYALNPHPKPWESRGELWFSMQVSNLFR